MQIARSNTRSMGPTPAIVDRSDRVIYLNDDIWDSLSQDQQRAVLLHEVGHLERDTHEEKQADEYAFDSFTQSHGPGSAKRFFSAWSSILDPDSHLEHKQRLLDIGLNAANHIHMETGHDYPKKVIRKARKDFMQNQNSSTIHSATGNYGLTGHERMDLYRKAIEIYKTNPEVGSPNHIYGQLLKQAQDNYDAENPFVPKTSYLIPDGKGGFYESDSPTGGLKSLNKTMIALLAALGIVVLIFIYKKFFK